MKMTREEVCRRYKMLVDMAQENAFALGKHVDGL